MLSFLLCKETTHLNVIFGEPHIHMPLPQHTHLSKSKAFCDPRKFGKCMLSKDLSSSFEELAPDALLLFQDVVCHDDDSSSKSKYQHALQQLTNKNTGIKSLLLDQRRAVSGVGNWVADEVLYQIQIHPDQKFLSRTQAAKLLIKLHSILTTAVDCLAMGQPYPATWLFHYRWTKKAAGEDATGKSLTFVKSGGRTSAIVLPDQQLQVSQEPLCLSSPVPSSKTLVVEQQLVDKTNGSRDSQPSVLNNQSRSTRKRKQPPITVSTTEKRTKQREHSNKAPSKATESEAQCHDSTQYVTP